MHYLIYKITNNINGNIYIGCHQTENINDDYMGSGKLIIRAIEKHGIDNFTKEILHDFDKSGDMFNTEAILVNENFIKRANTYNMKTGGIGSWSHVNDHKLNNLADQCYIVTQKINESAEYREWFCERISTGLKKYYKTHDASFLGKHHTDETKKKIGLANSKHQTGKGNSQYGKMWIYNLELKQSKKINKNDLQKWIDKEWIKGRKMIF